LPEEQLRMRFQNFALSPGQQCVRHAGSVEMRDRRAMTLAARSRCAPVQARPEKDHYYRKCDGGPQFGGTFRLFTDSTHRIASSDN
jgi:hypothetical protein